MLSLTFETRDVNAYSKGSCTSLFLFSNGAADVDAEAAMFVTDPEVPT